MVRAGWAEIWFLSDFQRSSAYLSPVAAAERIGGGRPRLYGRRREEGGGGGGERRCTAGYSACIPPGPDVDCRGGSGNGPRYVDGPVRVTGSDPYDLDSDGDGVGCE
jgi:hypothetical protein